MKITQDLEPIDRDKLRDKLKNTYRNNSMNLDNFGTHFEAVLKKNHCYKVNIFASDYRKIWIYSCISDLSPHPNQLLSEVIKYITSHQDIFNISYPMFLDIKQVRLYLAVLSQCQSNLKDCFRKLNEGDCFLLEDEVIKVTDGMHRLVAYGLASQLIEENFPIAIYLGTNKSIEEIESI